MRQDQLTHAWNAFTGPEIRPETFKSSSFYPAHHSLSRRFIPKSQFTSAVFNRIAIDVAMTSFSYVKIDATTQDEVPYPKEGIHKILNEQANIDQTAFQFMQDVVYSMFDEGVVAVVPVDTDIDPNHTSGFSINSMRVGKILEWYPKHVRVSLYDERFGEYKDIIVAKNRTAILENPLYAVVNGNNSTLTRLIQKMSMMDNMDEILSSGRLDILIQLPYALKTEARIMSAQERINNIAKDLAHGKNGIAYIDATEKITQLNRPANTQVVENAKMLQEEFYNQLGLTPNVMNGTATESEMRLYYSRSIDPIVKAILQEFNRKFISTKAATIGYTLVSYRDNFSMTPVEQIATLSDTLKRNAVLTSNEVRRLMGFRPHNDPEADRLTNPNMPEKDKGPGSIASPEDPTPNLDEEIQNGGNIAEKEVD